MLAAAIRCRAGKALCLAGLVALAGAVFAADTSLVTALAGSVGIGKAAADDLQPFTRLRLGDRLTLAPGARLQLLYFDGARQEAWTGPGALEVGETSSRALHGAAPTAAKVLPAHLVRRLARMPSFGDGGLVAAPGRSRALPSASTLESLQRNYENLRRSAEAGDRNPELYLLSGLFELREFDRIDVLLRQLAEKSPGDFEIRVLRQLYARAMRDAQGEVSR